MDSTVILNPDIQAAAESLQTLSTIALAENYLQEDQKRSSSKRAAKKNEPFESKEILDPRRIWKTVFVNKNFVEVPKNSSDELISVRTKTRSDTPSLTVPERMYSSLKYELLLSAIPDAFQKGTIPFLLARICVVDAQTFKVIKKNNKNVLKGNIESVLNAQNGQKDSFTGKLKVQFTDVSYHREKREFRWEISFYLPNDLENPVLILRSASFRVYARKPNVKKVKKRKASEMVSPVTPTSATSNPFPTSPIAAGNAAGGVGGSTAIPTSPVGQQNIAAHKVAAQALPSSPSSAQVPPKVEPNLPSPMSLLPALTQQQLNISLNPIQPKILPAPTEAASGEKPAKLQKTQNLTLEQRIEAVMEANRKLPNEERKRALLLVMTRFMQIDPAYVPCSFS